MKTYRLTTPEIQIGCYKVAQVNSVTRAHHTIILTDKNGLTLASLEFSFALILAGIIFAL